MVTLNIPVSPAALTPGWLTEALRSTATIRDTEVTSFETEVIGQGAGFIGQLAGC